MRRRTAPTVAYIAWISLMSCATAPDAPEGNVRLGEPGRAFSHSNLRTELSDQEIEDVVLKNTCLRNSMAIHKSLEFCENDPETIEKINESLEFHYCTGSALYGEDRNAVFYVTTLYGDRWILNVGYSFAREQYTLALRPYPIDD